MVWHPCARAPHPACSFNFSGTKHDATRCCRAARSLIQQPEQAAACHVVRSPFPDACVSTIQPNQPDSISLQYGLPGHVSAIAPLLRAMLQVFDAKDWDALVMRSIVPKLAWALQDVLVINPLQQDLAPFHWLTAWHPVLPQHHMVNLLEFRFFPAWHRVLQHWLSSQPDFDEVTRWYLGWKVSLIQ